MPDGRGDWVLHPETVLARTTSLTNPMASGFDSLGFV